MTTQTVINIVLDETNEDGLEHVMCCKDDDVLLCGMDGKNMPINDEENVEITCVVCYHIEIAQYEARSCIGCPKRR